MTKLPLQEKGKMMETIPYRKRRRATAMERQSGKRKIREIFLKEVDNPWRIDSMGSMILTMIDAIDLLSVKQKRWHRTRLISNVIGPFSNALISNVAEC